MDKMDKLVIKAGRLIDGTGALPLDNATIVIEHDRITEVGQDIEIPRDAQLIDATGKTVMPGMIDAHRHFYGVKPDDTEIDDISQPKELRLIKAVFDAKKSLSSGFTTAKDCNGMNGIYLKQAAAENILTGVPRIVASGYWLENTQVNHYPYLPQEYIDARTSRIAGQIGANALICDGVDECIKATRYVLSRGADFIKLLSRDNMCFNAEELMAIVQTAAQVGKFVTVHCDNSIFARSAILAGVKTIDHAVGINDEAIELGNKAGVIFVSTLAVMQAVIDFGDGIKRMHHGSEWAKGMLEKMCQSYKRIRSLGGTLALGTDYGGECLMENYSSAAVELELLVKYCDFTPMDAIQAATKNAAMACFMGDKTGTIEPGKYADVIIVEGDPLININILQQEDNIKMVMLEGKVEINRSIAF